MTAGFAALRSTDHVARRERLRENDARVTIPAVIRPRSWLVNKPKHQTQTMCARCVVKIVDDGLDNIFSAAEVAQMIEESVELEALEEPEEEIRHSVSRKLTPQESHAAPDAVRVAIESTEYFKVAEGEGFGEALL